MLPSQRCHRTQRGKGQNVNDCFPCKVSPISYFPTFISGKIEPPLNIPLEESDREILKAIGSVKRQKQRPCVDRIHGFLVKNNTVLFQKKEMVEAKLDRMVDRKLLTKIDNLHNGIFSYRELNSAQEVVARYNPIKTRAHLLPEEGQLDSCLVELSTFLI